MTAGAIVTLSSDASVSPTFTAPPVAFDKPAEILTFQLVVSDANATSAAASVNVTVSPEAPPPAPIANAGTDQAVASGASVTLDGSASSGPAGLPLTFAWSQSSGPAVVLTGADTATPSFTAPVVPAGSPAVTLGFS
ncbi:MAG: PKD domain-containing protein, partial [Myxococcales bacterium]